MRNILVIGGSYFAGRVLVEALSRKPGTQVQAFNRGNIPLGIPGVGHIRGDREIPAHIAERIPQQHWDAVIDFCAYTPEHIRTMLQGLPGTVGQYIFISTTSVYAPAERFPIPEEAAKVNGPQPELGEYAEYGFEKWQAEQALEQECTARNIPFTVLRPAIIYGRYNYAPRESFFFDQIIAGQSFVIPEPGNFFYSFIWVDDLADIILACLGNPRVQGRAFNVAAEERISYAGLARALEEVCGRRLERRVVGLEEIVRNNIFLPFPPDLHLLYDGAGLRKTISFEPIPFVLGLARTWRDYQAVIRRRKALGG